MTEDKTVKGILHGVPVTVTIKGKPDYIPTTEEVRYKYSWWTDKNLVARGVEPTDTKAEFDRWLNEVKREVWDEAVNQVIATVRCDSEDITWVNKNPYRQES